MEAGLLALPGMINHGMFSCLALIHYEPEMDRADAAMLVIDSIIEQSPGKLDHRATRDAGMYLAMLAMKDIKWKKAPEGPDVERIITAFHEGRDSLL